jgi:hypothetical protein
VYLDRGDVEQDAKGIGVMTEEQFLHLQQILLWLFQPFIGWWLVALVAASFSMAVLIIFFGLFRWMTSKLV